MHSTEDHYHFDQKNVSPGRTRFLHALHTLHYGLSIGSLGKGLYMVAMLMQYSVCKACVRVISPHGYLPGKKDINSRHSSLGAVIASASNSKLEYFEDVEYLGEQEWWNHDLFHIYQLKQYIQFKKLKSISLWFLFHSLNKRQCCTWLHSSEACAGFHLPLMKFLKTIEDIEIERNERKFSTKLSCFIGKTLYNQLFLLCPRTQHKLKWAPKFNRNRKK